MGGESIGYAGADVRAGGDLESVCFFGVDIELHRQFGLPNSGSAVAIRNKGARLRPWTMAACQRNGTGICDLGVVRQNTSDSVSTLVELSASLTRSGSIPVAVGCDHTVSYPQALGVSIIRPISYVYFDAHLDLGWHLPGPLAGVSNATFVSYLLRETNIKDIVNIGARAPSCYEPPYVGLKRPRVISFESVEAVIRELEFLAGANIYVSVDADVLDRAFLAGACCPEPFGVRPLEVLHVLRWLHRRCCVLGADISEWCATGPDDRGAELLMRLMVELTVGPASEERGC